MISYLQGKTLFVDENRGAVILGVNGVGYELLCSRNSLDQIHQQSSLELWVYTHVREDQLQLFGFYEQKEKELFLSLIKVNGIGAKMALNILSAAPFERLLCMIGEGDSKALVKLPKVGKKIAEQMVLALKGKLFPFAASETSQKGQVRNKIVSALVNLGFKLSDVDPVVDKMEDLNVEEGIREGLSALSQKQGIKHG